MKIREIDDLIREIAKPYFSEEGFLCVKKDSGYIKKIEGERIRYGFSCI